MIDDPYMKKMLDDMEMERDYNHMPPIPVVNLETKIVKPSIGGGSSRIVYNSTEAGRVIKEMKGAFPLANFTEYFVWTSIRQSPKWRQVFGEVFAISEDGKLLEMELLPDLASDDWPNLPDFPDFVKDPKSDNFGKTANGVIKIRDFGICNIDFLLNAAEKNHGAVHALRKLGV